MKRAFVSNLAAKCISFIYSFKQMDRLKEWKQLGRV